jgi:hypothetical protein
MDIDMALKFSAIAYFYIFYPTRQTMLLICPAWPGRQDRPTPGPARRHGQTGKIR